MTSQKPLRSAGTASSNAPLRGSKRSVYEGGHRVPFVARWPGKIKPGSVNDQTICLNDLMATAAEIAGAKVPADAGEDRVSQLIAIAAILPEPTAFQLTDRLHRQPSLIALNHPRFEHSCEHQQVQRLKRVALTVVVGTDAAAKMLNDRWT
jgi:arylsulfatase A-like enzyme